MTTLSLSDIKLRPLERNDLHFVHQINNNSNIMRYWFEEPYEAYVELVQLYDRHIHDQSERRFIIENGNGDLVGLVELVEINYIHRRGEFQILIAPAWQGRKYAERATQLAVDYAFGVLNLYKLYLFVDKENFKAIHIYKKCGFTIEGELIGEFFVNGVYRDAIRMYRFQTEYLQTREAIKAKNMAAILRPLEDS